MIENDVIDGFRDLYRTIKILRGPNGCPWDKEQTVFSIAANLIEESHEFSEAAAKHPAPESIKEMREELGDVFLVALMLGVIADEDDLFSLYDSLKEITAKLLRRHPHVFSNSQASTSREVITQWDKIKSDVEGKPGHSSLDSVPKNLPPLMRAEKVQKKAAKSGFDWENHYGPLSKIKEETEEISLLLRDKNAETDRITEELGDILFSIVNLSRHLKIDSSLALQKATQKFITRYEKMKTIAENKGVDISFENAEELDKIWESIKKKL
ncbi:MAG: nucleoside triphosphate pyrophosphohydrolase [Spirochaetia bacterium]